MDGMVQALDVLALGRHALKRQAYDMLEDCEGDNLSNAYSQGSTWWLTRVLTQVQAVIYRFVYLFHSVVALFNLQWLPLETHGLAAGGRHLHLLLLLRADLILALLRCWRHCWACLCSCGDCDATCNFQKPGKLL